MSEGPKKAEDSLNVLSIATIGIVVTLLVWASVVGLEAYYNATEGKLAQEREVEGIDTGARTIRARQKEQLSQYRVLDAKTGRVTIDIADAKKQVVAALRANPGASAVPALGNHDQPSIPAVWGRPADKPPAGGAAPAEGATPAEGAAPSEGEAPTEAAPTEEGGQAPAEGGQAPAEGGAEPAKAGGQAPAESEKPAEGGN